MEEKPEALSTLSRWRPVGSGQTQCCRIPSSRCHGSQGRLGSFSSSPASSRARVPRCPLLLSSLVEAYLWPSLVDDTANSEGHGIKVRPFFEKAWSRVVSLAWQSADLETAGDSVHPAANLTSDKIMMKGHGDSRKKNVIWARAALQTDKHI